jgi:hypothetical protein
MALQIKGHLAIRREPVMCPRESHSEAFEIVVVGIDLAWIPVDRGSSAVSE